MLRYEQIAQNETKLLALTGLTCQEFQDLVPVFQISLETVLREHTMDGLHRVGRGYTIYRTSPSPTSEDKLRFDVFETSTYPNPARQLFGMSQSNANTWTHLLYDVLNRALAHAGHLPPRVATVNARGPTEPQPAPPLFGTMAPNDQ